jgi:putative DNA methylase
MTVTIKTPKKLIEVALPLDVINEAAAKEKSTRHGHPSTLHLWWARRPLAAARAVIFAQMVNDPGYERSLGRGVNKEKAQIERERLFGIIRKLVQWENTNNESVLTEAREEIWKSWRETCELNRGHPQAAKLFNSETLPAFHDPFAGGGALPLEAQRLGLESYASDLNPVAVLINKAMIEIPSRFAARVPVGPIPISEKQTQIPQEWTGSKGLAEDVRRYGEWMREESLIRIGHLYPLVDLPKKHGGGKARVIAWIWARTVKSPNPAFSHVDVPLASSFVLASKAGKEVYVQPVIEGDTYYFVVNEGTPPTDARNGTKAAGSGSAFLCMLSKTPMDFKYLREEAKRGRMGQRLMAIVVEGKRGRIYLSPTQEQETLAKSANSSWKPDTALPEKALGFRVQEYGMLKWSDLFTARQLAALECFTGLVQEVRERVLADTQAAHWEDDGRTLEDGGSAGTSYADAVSVYLSFAIDRMAMTGNNLVRWNAVGEKAQHCFGRQAFPMLWDFAEPNFLADSTGSLSAAVFYSYDPIAGLPTDKRGTVVQADAQSQTLSEGAVVSTDPPYYDNIGYGDLSDFFYVWLRRSLRNVYPKLFATMTVPKTEELVATPFRHGNKSLAEAFFLKGMTEAMRRLSAQAHPAFPTTIYYAFKQSETTNSGTGNTGWETFLEAVIRAGFTLTGTWPMRTEMKTRQIAMGTNALASSIVLVCRHRDLDSPTVSRRDFLREMKGELADAVEVMIGGAEGVSPVAPVDLAQAVIGPGMAIFSKYSAVLEADGSPMTVHTALTLINRMLTEGVDDYDGDTQFCLGWFDEYGWSTGDFGQADVLARAKGTSVAGVQDSGVVEAGNGNVRLFRPSEYPADWNPEEDNRTPVWEALHQMIRALQSDSESAAGALLARMPERAEPIRSLAYRLYTLCERKGWTDEARGYNELITSWLGIEAASHEAGIVGSQSNLDI